MKKSFLYITWAFLICLFLIVLVPMVYAQTVPCDSATNSNCIETNSNTNSTTTSTIDSTTNLKSPPPSAMARVAQSAFSSAPFEP